MPQEYVAIVGNAPNAPIQAYVAVVDASGNVISGSYGPPGGRLTLTTLTPVMVATVSAAASVLYTPYNDDIVPIYNGTSWLMTQFAELSNVLANSAVGSAGPAAAANNSNYDLFVWNNAGVMTLTRGPAWTSDTARSAGTALTLQNGLLLNSVAITNGPAALRGTYVGTIRTNGTATVDMIFGASGAAAFMAVWNAYNRVNILPRGIENTASWTYTTGTIRAANNTALTRVSFIRGLDEDMVEAQYQCEVTLIALAGAFFSSFVLLDGTTAQAATSTRGFVISPSGVATGGTNLIARYTGFPGAGWHFVQGGESGDGSNANTINANNLYQMITATLRA
jgi:hypothetical protein